MSPLPSKSMSWSLMLTKVLSLNREVKWPPVSVPCSPECTPMPLRSQRSNVTWLTLALKIRLSGEPSTGG
jgi:hypothetical protein